MDFGDFARLIFRRWYVSVPLLLMTMAASVYTLATAKPDYVLTSYVQLVPPTSDAQSTQSASNGQPRNPWNVLGLGALSQATKFATQDQTFLDQLAGGGHSTAFTIEVGYPNPVVTIQVTAATRVQAEETTDLIVKRYEDTAQTLQTHYNVKSGDMITTRRLDQGENITTSNGKVKQSIILVGFAGLLLTVGATVAFDAMLRRRSRRRDQRRAALAGKRLAPEHNGPERNGSEYVGSGRNGSERSGTARNGRQPAAGAALPVSVSAGLLLEQGAAEPVDKAHRSGPARDEPATGRTQDPSKPEDGADGSGTAEPRPMPPDATIVLALPHWSGGGNRGKRR